MSKCFLAACVLILALGSTIWAQLRTKPALTLDAARKAASAAGTIARQNNWKVAIAILDDGAHLVYFERMDGVQIAGIEIAMRKAASAVKYKRPSKAFADRVASEPHSVMLPGSFPFEGGLPIVVDGEVIGGVGVTGMASAQDAQLAQAAVEAINKAAAR